MFIQSPMQIVMLALQVLSWVIIIDVVLSYIPSVPRHNPAVMLIHRVSDAVVSPFRKLVPPQRVGEVYVDFSPIFALLALWVVGAFLSRM